MYNKALVTLEKQMYRRVSYILDTLNIHEGIVLGTYRCRDICYFIIHNICMYIYKILLVKC